MSPSYSATQRSGETTMGLFKKAMYLGSGAFVVGEPAKAVAKSAKRKSTAREILALEEEIERQRAKKQRAADQLQAKLSKP